MCFIACRVRSNCGIGGTLQSFEIPDIPVRWYTFKRRPLQSPSTDLELSEEAGGDKAADDAEDGGDKEGVEEEHDEDVTEEVLPPPPALKAAYARGGGEKFLLAMGGWARGAIFECAWEVRRTVADVWASSD